MNLFTSRHRFDRWFWIAFVVQAWFAVFAGFAERVGMRFRGQADYPAPPELVIHVVSFFGWLTVLSLQVALVETRRTGLHRMLGLSALALAPVMAWSAVAAEVYSQRFYATIYPDGVEFFPIPVTSSSCFLVCALGALAVRQRPDWHKRLIYLATTAILVAAYFRWWGDAIYAALPAGALAEWLANFLGVALLLLIGAGYDLATREAIHPVFRWGIPAFLLAQVAAVSVGQSGWWPPVGRQLLGIP